jgi:outer membrane protein TolC
LSGIAGFTGTSVFNWFQWPSLAWAVGTSLSQTLFDAGRRRAQSEEAVASYDAMVAQYRETTLEAFQQVEDNLSALRILELEAAQQKEAVAAATNSLRIFTNRYVGGVDSYLQIKAIGGGWTRDQLPALTGFAPHAFDVALPGMGSGVAPPQP